MKNYTSLRFDLPACLLICTVTVLYPYTYYIEHLLDLNKLVFAV